MNRDAIKDLFRFE